MRVASDGVSIELTKLEAVKLEAMGFVITRENGKVVSIIHGGKKNEKRDQKTKVDKRVR